MKEHDGVEVSFLGGLGEIGRNMATIEVDGRLAIVDVGVLFPDAEHLGVDLILADWSWVSERGDDVEAVFLTHGHLDHIGALPYLLRDLDRKLDVYGTRLTIAFCEAILEEWPDIQRPRFHEVEPGDRVKHGPFDVEAVQVSHSIPDGVAFAFRTPEGLIVHTGDFKLDQSPLDGRPTDLAHFARLGDEGVDLLLADSTGAENPGHVSPERTIGATLRQYVMEAEGLVIVASFASHVHRIQQVLDAALAVGRRPVFVGRSLVRNMAIAEYSGCLPEHVFICEDGGSLWLRDGEVSRGDGHPTSHVYIDGLLDDVGPALLRDRRRIGEDGICVAIVTVDTHSRKIAGDTIVTQKGVVFHERADDILEAARKAVEAELDRLAPVKFEDLAAVQRLSLIH